MLQWSLPLAVAHEAVALYEMQMLFSRLTPAIFISLGKAVACRIRGRCASGARRSHACYQPLDPKDGKFGRWWAHAL
jgi:hypothetical protein